MKQVLLMLSLLPLTNSLFAQTKNSKDSAEQTLIQMEFDWSQADVKKDAATLNRIMADDWMGIDFEGAVMTKADVMRDLHSDATATESTELREVKGPHLRQHRHRQRHRHREEPVQRARQQRSVYLDRRVRVAQRPLAGGLVAIHQAGARAQVIRTRRGQPVKGWPRL